MIELKDYLVYVVRRLFSQEICVRLQSNEENAERPDNTSDLQKLESLCEDLHSCVQKLVRSVHNKLSSSFNESKKKKEFNSRLLIYNFFWQKKLVLKMKAVANKFHGVQNLSQYKNDCDVMFQTWSTKDFGE